LNAGATELLILRLGLIAVILVFAAVVALSLRSTLLPTPARRAAARTSSWKLVVVAPAETGLDRSAVFVLAGTMVVGRDARAGIALGDPSVSVRHASISPANGGWRVADLGSTNGTFVEGRPVDAKGVLLRGRERLTFGNVVLQLVAE